MANSQTGQAPNVTLTNDQFQVLFASFLELNQKLDFQNQRSSFVDNEVAFQHDFPGKDASFMNVVRSYFTNRDTLSTSRINFETSAPSFVKPRRPEELTSGERQAKIAELEQLAKDLKVDKSIDPTTKSRLFLDITSKLELLEKLEEKDQLVVKF